MTRGVREPGITNTEAAVIERLGYEKHSGGKESPYLNETLVVVGVWMQERHQTVQTVDCILEMSNQVEFQASTDAGLVTSFD